MTKKIKTTLISAFLVCSVIVPVRGQQVPTNLRSSALRLIDRLHRESSVFFSARRDLVHWFCLNHKYDEALEQTTRLPVDERFQLLALIAGMAIEANDRKATNTILAEALSISQKHDNDESSFDVVYTFAELAIKNQDVALASKFVSMLDEGSAKKSRALLKLAHQYADLSDPKQAMACADEAMAQTSGFDEDEQSELIRITVDAASVMLAIGELERGREFANKATGVLLGQTKPESDDQVAVASVLAAVGNLTQAVGMVESMDLRNRISGFATLSLHCHDHETARLLLDRSRDLVLNKRTDTYSQSIRVSSLVSAYFKANRVDEGLELLNRITDPYELHRSAILAADLLRKSSRHGDAEKALDMARTVAEKIISEKSEDIPGHASFSQASGKSHILSRLVESYIDLGSPSRAELAAKAIDHPQYRASALSKVAVAYKRKGEISKARGLLVRALALSINAKEYNHDKQKEDGLFDVARAMGEAGFDSDFAIAVHRFLQQLKKSEYADQYVGALFILGDIAESAGVALNTPAATLLKQIEQQFGDN